MTPSPPTPAEVEALREFAALHGPGWKAQLRYRWLNATATATLHRLRNTHGPAWLDGYRLDRDEEAEDG
jgi:hypothetical protein